MPDPKATALEMIQENLAQLNMSYVDLLLLHEPCDRKHGQPNPIDQLAWEALIHATTQGWARAIGVDKFTIAQMEALHGMKPAVFMGPVSLADHDEELIAYCQAHGIQYNAFSIFHGCIFSDPLVQSLAEKYNITTAQVCGVWTRQRGFTMAIGAGTDPVKIAEHVPEDLDIFSVNLTSAEVDALTKLQNREWRHASLV